MRWISRQFSAIPCLTQGTGPAVWPGSHFICEMMLAQSKLEPLRRLHGGTDDAAANLFLVVGLAFG